MKTDFCNFTKKETFYTYACEDLFFCLYVFWAPFQFAVDVTAYIADPFDDQGAIAHHWFCGDGEDSQEHTAFQGYAGDGEEVTDKEDAD